MGKISRSKGLFTVLSLLVAFTGAGCNSDTKPTSDGAEPVPPLDEPAPQACELGSFPEGNGIINGKPLHPAFEVVPNIVRIYSVRDDGNANVCTGTLLDSDTVLTAAHCVNDMYDAKQILVHFHHDPACEPDGLLNNKRDKVKDASRANIRQASAFLVHAEFTTDYLINDLALIKLSQPAPATARPVVLTSWNSATASMRTRVLAAGYGKIGGYDLKDQNHRLRYGWIKPLGEEARRERIVGNMKDHGFVGDRERVDGNWLFFDQSDANGVCAGDSGGPAFIKVDGHWSQVGVASFVTNVTPMGGEVCKDVGVHVNLDAHRNWLGSARLHLRTSTGRTSF